MALFKLKTKIWIYEGQGAWHFATIDKNISSKIKSLGILKRGWGSIPVTATIKKTSWKTSIFPHQKDFYILPIKKSVRISEKISSGDTVLVKIKIEEEF